MKLSRLVYMSESRIDPTQGSVIRQLGSILSASNRNNRANAITGALIFDDSWFLQVLEGDKRAIWKTFQRIYDDERHGDTLLVEMTDIGERAFGDWWMGLATRSEVTEAAFAPYLRNGIFSPEKMNAAEILALMVGVSRLGLHREMRNAA